LYNNQLLNPLESGNPTPFREKEATSARLNKQEAESQASPQELNPMYLYELRSGIKF